MTRIQRLFKCSNGCEVNQHGRFNYDKPQDLALLWLWRKWDRFTETPKDFRRWLAFKLRWWSACLMGEKYTDGGWGVRENESARIRDRIVFFLVPKLVDADEAERDEIHDLMDDVDRLAYLAGMNWYLEEEETK